MHAKLKAVQARKWENMAFCLLQNTRNLQHIYMRSPILAVTLHTALENDSTVPAGWYCFTGEVLMKKRPIGYTCSLE